MKQRRVVNLLGGKRLFVVMACIKGKPTEMIFTGNKMEAKAIRDDLINEGVVAWVRRGPDNVNRKTA